MSEGGEPSAPATPGLLLLSYTTPRDAAGDLVKSRYIILLLCRFFGGFSMIAEPLQSANYSRCPLVIAIFVC